VVFTQNAFRAAPVLIAAEHSRANQGDADWLLVNTGNANAGTGEHGKRVAIESCQAVADLTGSASDRVLPFSTGVIGEPLSAELITRALPLAVEDLCDNNWERAAAAILTTDTRAKLRSVSLDLGGQTCVITGMAKGAGMICPNMATMLGFIGTDAQIAPGLLDTLLRTAVAASFNRISVDGDTSTNDAVTLSATGQSSVVLEAESPTTALFLDALTTLMIELAHDIVRDGEGATKFVEVRIEGGASEAACDQVARTIAHSPLVKTALFASDPNWGRLLMAIGRAGVENLNTSVISIYINGVLIAEEGARAASYTEEAGQAAMADRDLLIEVNLNQGSAASSLWTTDLSYDYVKINADYRT
jgi:glutamate N-acetyltransferase/amino-acid N-acetyltransferase